ncbi:MAG: DNA replication and repair protein RecF, partial [Proteobacteria bacterium]|nr:DNA replication and repair protein RecF [Pseudomonadota bacterium]
AAEPAHAGRVSAYEQAMRERSRLLAEAGAGADTGWLQALETSMAEKGIAVAWARREMLGRLAKFLEGNPNSEPWPFPSAEVTLAGGPEGWLDHGPALAAEDAFRARLAAERPIDAADGRTRTGPHRTDMRVRLIETGRDAEFCSTGEQKALMITLVLAHARMQAAAERRPVLLLDEIAAHLDANRRGALFDILCGLGAQVWMTGADPELFDGMRGRARFFRIADATVNEAE